MAISLYVPNLGRPTGKPGPVSLWKYTDTEGTIPVNLIVVPAAGGFLKFVPTARDALWMITWNVGTTNTGHDAQRRLQVFQEHADNLTNWGPVTVADEPGVRPRKSIIIKSMSLAEREALEAISLTTNIKYASTGWNGQDWCAEVLQTACDQGILTQAEVDHALAQAQEQ